MRAGSAKPGVFRARESATWRGQKTTAPKPASAGGASLSREGRSVAEEATLEHGFREGKRSWRPVIENQILRRLRSLRAQRLENSETLNLKLCGIELNLGFAGK